MRGSRIALACATLAAATAAQSQTYTAPLAPVAVSGQAVLRAQTPIMLRMAEELTTKGKKLRVGQRFNMEVAEAVSVDGQTVIPVGSPATGEITDVRNKGMWGKSGRIGARLVSVRVGDRTIRLSGAMDDKGVTGSAGVVGAVAFVPIAGFLVTGTSAKIPMGAQIKGFIDEDVPLAFQASAPAPMVVPAAPAPMTVPGPSATSAPVSR